MAIKIAFYVSGRATRLVKSLTAFRQASFPFLDLIDFVFIDNVENRIIRDLCIRARIRLFEHAPSSAGWQAGLEISSRLHSLMRERNVDYLFVFGNKILGGKLLREYFGQIINFHPSLLPAFPGLNAIDQALEAGSLWLGNTAHIITEKVDGGPIIMQSMYPAAKFRSYDDVLDMQIPMLAQLIVWLHEKRIFISGNKASVANASYRTSAFLPNLEELVLKLKV